ncbi:hypothetical protein [Dokdonella soli]|uniref:hypothetical protein n=1 Tax=Dokdonella soli TaxID=529810 RepID=UPI0031E0789C
MLLPPGSGLVDHIEPLSAGAADVDIDRHLHRASEFALAFWWMVAGVAFLVFEPRRVARTAAAWRGEPMFPNARRMPPEEPGDALAAATTTAGAISRGLGAIGGHAVDALVERSVQLVEQPPATLVAAGGFLQWLASHLPWLIKRGLVSLVMALLLAGSSQRFLFGLLVTVLVMPWWAIVLDLTLPILLGVAAWALFTRGLETLLRFGTVTRCDLWTGICQDVNVWPLATLIWIPLMLASLLRAWLEYRRSRSDRLLDGALQRARARIAERRGG